MNDLFKDIFEPIPTDIISSFTTKTTRYERILKEKGSSTTGDRRISEFSMELPLGDDPEVCQEDVRRTRGGI